MNERTTKEWTLRELAAETGVAERTIRFYISRGLLDPPLRGGRSAAYGEAHKARLEEIRKLQAKGMMLAEIAHVLALAEGGGIAGVTEKRLRVTKSGGGDDEVRHMLWFEMDGSVDKRLPDAIEKMGQEAVPELANVRPMQAVPASPLVEPETWRSYSVAPDVVVMFRAGASPWRTKRLVSALRRFAAQVEDTIHKEDKGE
jgi:DNA-binding transcriptional MerR regulator